MPDRVRITDVAPRDGLQNEPLRPDGSAVPIPESLGLIAALSSSGVNEVEVTSFVSPKWVPQFTDAPGLLLALARFVAQHRQATSPHPLPAYSALVPNEKGLETFLAANQAARTAAGIDHLLTTASVFTAASETFSKKNTNVGIDQSIARFKPVIAGAQQHRFLVRAYISCVISCPYEGPVPPAAVAGVAEKLVATGADEIDLGDTIGTGTPQTIRAMLKAVLAALGDHWLPRIVLHLHDTFGLAPACVREALDLGIRAFDGSVAGLGGCPYASRPGSPAPGNIATDLLVGTIHDAGYVTTVDLPLLSAATDTARRLIARNRSTPFRGPLQ